MTKPLIAILAISTILCSCANKNIVQTSDAKLLLSDSISLIPAAESFFGGITFRNKHNSLEIAYLSEKKNKIYLIREKSIIDSFNVKSKFSNAPFFFFIDDTNSIFILPTNENCIYKLKDSVITNKYLYHQEGNKLTFFPISSPFEIKKNTVILNRSQNISLNIPEQSNEFFSSHSLIKLALRNDSMVEIRSFLPFPKEYIKNTYEFFWPFYCSTGNDMLVYNFSPNYIGTVNEKTGDQKDITINGLAKNDYIQPNKDSAPSLAYSKRISQYSDEFTGILRDPITENVIFIQSLKYSAQNTEIYNSIYEDKEAVLNIMDLKKNSVIRKITFENQKRVWFANSYYLNNILYVANRTHTKIYVYNLK